MSTEEYNEYVRKDSKTKYDLHLLKCEPQIVKIIRKMHAGKLDEQEYPFIGENRPKVNRATGLQIEGSKGG